jgi:xanthine dehydrogenase large subunit
VDADGQLLVHASTQHPSETQHMIAHVLGISNAQVVVRCLRMGGGFGGKETQANAFACMVALAAWKTGRAVRIKLSREHDMKLTGKRHGFRTDWDLGFDHDGRIHALRATMVADAGWSCDLSPPVLLRAMVHVDNAYYLPHVDIEGWMAKTHKVSNTAFRGFGGPQGMLIIEDILSHVARHLQLAPELVRLRNFYQSADQLTHYLQPVGEVRIQRIFDELLQSAEFVARRAAIAQHNASHAWRKKGLAITPVKFGISFNKVEYNQAGALVLIYRDGSVQINHGGTEMGQGLHTKMQAVAARSLGIDAQLIRVMTTATDKVPNTSATAASSGADLNGQAVHRACKEILQRMSEVLRAHWTLANDVELTMVDGQIRYQQRSITFVELVELCYSARVSLSATGFYATPGLSFDLSTNTGNPFYYFSWGAAVSEVSIDGYTGEWKLVRADLLHDAGESLNPLIDIGQIEGGFVQGMGWLTMEELVWDSAGKLRTFAPSTYKIPTISEVPTQFHTALLQGAAQPGVIFGSKAVGEPPLMLAISVREALRDAVAAFASNPQQRIELAAPATPEAILRAVDAVR